MRRLTRIAAALGLACCLLGGPPFTRADDGPAPKLWVVLVATSEHDQQKWNLPYTDNDVKELRRILRERGSVPAEQILQLTDSAGKDARPTLATLRTRIPRFLEKAGEDDRVLVFFGGHGTPHKGLTYLIPRDFDEDKPESTGLPIGELRKMFGACKAQHKFLVLDCCHAGNDRSVAPRSLPAETVARSVMAEESPGVIVLASSRADQKSWAWPARKQGIFTFWLCRALEGAAANEDGEVTVSKVNTYVHDRVDQTARLDYGRPQDTVLFGKIEGDPVLLKLLPEQPETLCRRLADQLDLEVRRKKLKRVAVLEFTMPLGGKEALARAMLPGTLEQEVRERLREISTDIYRVPSGEDTHRLARDLRLGDVGKRDGLAVLARGDAGVDGIVYGTLRPSGPDYQVECRLYTTADGRSSATIQGLLPATEERVAEVGGSFDNRQRPPGSPSDRKVIAFVQEQATEQHPLVKNDFPFRLEVWAAPHKPGQPVPPAREWKKKDFIQLDDGLAIGAHPDELYEIRVWNGSRNRVAMQLLVDGLNTLGQVRTDVREGLGSGTAWVLEKMTPENKPFVCEGWHFPKAGAAVGTVEQTTMKRFRFVDAGQSAAARQQFGESLGLITAAFYAEQGKAIGTGEGPEEKRLLRTVDFRPGRLEAVVQIRYFDDREGKK
jgi:hypothetical protein